MPDRPPRKRIQTRTPETALPAINDPLEYKANKCVAIARNATFHDHGIRVTIWHSKHYVDRYTTGDENGLRDGIDPAVAESMIKRSFRLFLACGAVLKSFHFVNHPGNTERIARVHIQEAQDLGKVNLTIEVHYIDIATYELTIITGIVKEDFYIGDGQFVLELDEEGTIMRKLDNKVLKAVFSF